MEPTKAPWADGGIGRVFTAPEPGVHPGIRLQPFAVASSVSSINSVLRSSSMLQFASSSYKQSVLSHHRVIPCPIAADLDSWYDIHLSQCCRPWHRRRLFCFAGQAQSLQQGQHHHRNRGYLTGVPVEPLVIAEAQMPAHSPSSPESQHSFRAPEKRIHNSADLDRCGTNDVFS